MAATVFNKAVIPKIKSSKMSPVKARKFSRAIATIDATPIEVMCKTGKAKRIHVAGQSGNVYMYRAGNKERIIFSVENEKKIVQDFVDVDNLQNTVK